MHKRKNVPVQPDEKQKNPNVRKTYSPVDPTHHITSVGLTGDRKKSARAQKRFFQLATFGYLNDWRIKSSPKDSNFGEMKMMTSKTHPQKISTKVLAD